MPLRALLVGWATATIPALALAAVASFVVPQAQQPEFPVVGGMAIFMLVVFAPVTETLIMAAVLAVLLRLLRADLAILASAIGWGIAHSFVAPVWGLVVWWPFLIFSTLFVTWRKHSLLAALAMPAAVHALHNLGPALVVASGQA